MQQTELMSPVSESTTGKSCAGLESLCKQRIYRDHPRYFSGTVLDHSQNLMENVGNISNTAMCQRVCAHSVWQTKASTSCCEQIHGPLNTWATMPKLSASGRPDTSSDCALCS